MTASQPTILATSAGYLPHPRQRFRFGPMIRFALELAGAPAPTSGIAASSDSSAARRPRVCNISTASGDDARFQRDMEQPLMMEWSRVENGGVCPESNHLIAKHWSWTCFAKFVRSAMHMTA
ncbi:hypothetical protein ACXET9_06400 [Brachybacterium sp. DNPG3]